LGPLKVFIGLVGFEPTASWSRTRRSTKLSHSPQIVATAPISIAVEFVTSRILKLLARAIGADDAETIGQLIGERSPVGSMIAHARHRMGKLGQQGD
jgi:hypothetical protein